MTRAILLAAVFVLLTSCQPASYKLVKRDLLLPPRASKQVSADLVLKHARKPRAAAADCDIAGSAESLAWDGDTARIHLAADLATPAGDLGAPEGVTVRERKYADDVRGLETFRSSLLHAEDSQCLEPAEGRRLMTEVTERLALSPNIVQALRFGNIGFSGYVDLTDGMALEISSAAGPIRYRMPGLRPEASRVDWIAFPASMEGFRLLFLTARSEADHDAVVLGAADRAALVDATQRIQEGGESTCRGQSRFVCALVPRGVAVNAMIPISVNGKTSFTILGGRLGGIVGASVPAEMRVRRLYRGKPALVSFDASQKDILGLVLMPGDEITWKH